MGLSGGPDSWALLAALQRLSGTLDIVVRAVCVDHGLRNESAAEAAAVAAQCQAYGVPCEVLQVDVASKRTAHVSLQDAARKARLEALAHAAIASSCDVVALGHTANDQAETVLFRIVRGTGVRGLAGIPYIRAPFVRPLLDVTRAQVNQFIDKEGIQPVRDPSNADPRFARARVRHEWLPLLAGENPKIVEALLSLAADARVQMPHLSQPSLLTAEVHLTARQRSAVDRVARKGGTCRLNVAGGDVVVTYGQARFEPRNDIQPCAPLPAPITIEAGAASVTTTLWGRLAVTFQSDGQTHSAALGLQAATFDLEKIVWPLTVRTRLAGDRVRPRDGRGSRKLQDMLVDSKIPWPDRAMLPVVVDGGGNILFVPGVRPSQIAAPTAATQSFFSVVAKNFVISPK